MRGQTRKANFGYVLQHSWHRRAASPWPTCEPSLEQGMLDQLVEKSGALAGEPLAPRRGLCSQAMRVRTMHHPCTHHVALEAVASGVDGEASGHPCTGCGSIGTNAAPGLGWLHSNSSFHHCCICRQGAEFLSPQRLPPKCATAPDGLLIRALCSAVPPPNGVGVARNV